MNWNIFNRSKSKTRGPRTYRHLDGALCDVSSFDETGLKRYMKSPVVYGAALTTLFCAAAQTMLSRPITGKATDFLINLALDGLLPSLLAFLYARDAINEAIKKRVAIDTSGYESRIDLQRTMHYIGEYIQTTVEMGFTSVPPLCASAGVAYGTRVVNPNLLPDELAEHTVLKFAGHALGSGGFYMLLLAVLAACAWGKLQGGKWKITYPPAQKSKQEEKVEAGVAEGMNAMIPVTTNVTRRSQNSYAL